MGGAGKDGHKSVLRVQTETENPAMRRLLYEVVFLRNDDPLAA